MSSLTDLYISDSYTGILHAGGVSLPASGKTTIFDGSGQASSLSLGKAGQGITIAGSLSAADMVLGELHYQAQVGPVGSFLIQKTDDALGFISKASSDMLEDSGVGADTYANIDTITVNAAGIITDITEFSDSNGMVITSTRYFPTQVVQRNQFTIPGSGATVGEWVEVNLTSVYKNAKAGIFFIGASTDNTGGTNQTLSRYVVSPNTEDVYYIASHIHSADNDGFGTQFQCPIGGSVGGNRYLYFRKENAEDAVSDDFIAELYGIASQQ